MPTSVTADTRQAFERLRSLSAELDGLSVDWQCFAQLAEQSGPAPDRAGQIDALAAVGCSGEREQALKVVSGAA